MILQELHFETTKIKKISSLVPRNQRDIHVPLTNSVRKFADLTVSHFFSMLELSLLRETSQNAFSRETSDCT